VPDGTSMIVNTGLNLVAVGPAAGEADF